MTIKQVGKPCEIFLAGWKYCTFVFIKSTLCNVHGSCMSNIATSVSELLLIDEGILTRRCLFTFLRGSRWQQWVVVLQGHGVQHVEAGDEGGRGAVRPLLLCSLHGLLRVQQRGDFPNAHTRTAERKHYSIEHYKKLRLQSRSRQRGD